MNEKYLYEIIEALNMVDGLKEIPPIIERGLSKHIVLRDYQKAAFRYFVTYYENEKLHKNKQIHTLFHMATGSGKTIIMAGLILYLYTKGYRKFLFFVNQSNVIEKTKENFINNLSNKYLFANDIEYLGKKIKIKKVDNFSTIDSTDIEICFTTTQKMHIDLNWSRENSLTYEDFENNKIVFISDESHHINSLTKKATKEEKEENDSWEYSVTNAFNQNKDNIMLEFTATADLKDKNVRNKYRDKIIFNYTLKEFRQSGYTKDFQNFATESDLWNRTLMALVLSEYRKFLFSDNRIDIKPVVLLKSQKIKESEDFYNIFFDKISKLTQNELISLYNTNMHPLINALDYFRKKDDSFELLRQSIKTSFTKENAIIINGKSDNNTQKQLVLNSLEDKENHIRVIFTVDMLNEGWDVLNLFDIVRLYDTRQGSGQAGKVGSYTIKEAQLIGRGARYCPFKITDNQESFKRKYDDDLNNPNRILETMYFHSKFDSKYIAELRQALIETGMQDKEPIQLDYVLKEEFSDSDFYKKALVFSNKRVPVNRKKVHSVEGKLQNQVYNYQVATNNGSIINLIGENEEKFSEKKQVINIKFKNIDYNILSGASEKFNELRFNVIKEKYPNVKSLKEFLTSEQYLGNSSVEIDYVNKLKGKDIFNACINAFKKISEEVINIKQEFQGTNIFEPYMLKDILKNKSIYISEIEKNGGKGDSQNYCSNPDVQLNLNKEKWYVFNDNYGTSEEKLFLKFFQTNIKPKLEEKNLEFYIIRNERIPQLAIYSFDNGERFEPDFLLLIKKKNIDNSDNSQIYIEPKGDNLLEYDKWKEDFLLKMKNTAITDPKYNFGNNYKIVGVPFFNNKYKRNEFEEYINKILNEI